MISEVFFMPCGGMQSNWKRFKPTMLLFKLILIVSVCIKNIESSLLTKMSFYYSKNTHIYPCYGGWGICDNRQSVAGFWFNLGPPSNRGLILSHVSDGYIMNLPPGYVQYGMPTSISGSPLYATGVGYIYIILFMDMTTACAKDCKVRNIIIDDVRAKLTTSPTAGVEYKTIMQHINDHDPAFDPFVVDSSDADVMRYKVNLHMYAYNFIGSKTGYGRNLLTAVYFNFNLTGADWNDPDFFKWMKRGGNPTLADAVFLDTYIPTNTYLVINGTAKERKDHVLSRKFHGENLGYWLPPGTTASSSYPAGVGTGAMWVVNVGSLKEMLQVSGASVEFKLDVQYTDINGRLQSTITAYYSLSNSAGTVVMNTWFTADGEGGTSSGNSSGVHQGSMSYSDIDSTVVAYMGASLMYKGDPQLDNHTCAMSVMSYIMIWSDPYLVTDSYVSLHRMQAVARAPMSCNNVNNGVLPLFDIYSIYYALSFQVQNLSDDFLKIGVKQAMTFNGFIDFNEFLPNYNYQMNDPISCLHSIPEEYRSDSDRQSPGCNLFRHRNVAVGTYIANCNITEELWNDLICSRCTRCNKDYYPDVMNFRELPMNTSCKKKDECQTTPGFVYVNNYEGTPFDYRGMCLSCPPNCNSCDSNLTCTTCKGNAVLNVTTGNCNCLSQWCIFCENSTCELCQYNTSLVVDQAGNRYCYYNGTARCSENYGLNVSFRYNNYQAQQYYTQCVPCTVKGCRLCELDATDCKDPCPPNTAPCDYYLALRETPEDFANYGTTSNCTNINTFIKGLVYDSNSGSFIPCIKGCIKCIATNTSECTRCVNDTVYLVDSLKCHSGTTCPPSTYLELAGGYRCKNCSIAHCVLCFDGSQECVNCETGYIFDQLQKKCIPRGDCNEANLQAIVNMTKSGVFTEACVKCPANCKTCSSNTTCSTCPSSYYLDSLSMCQKCLRGCSQCSSNTTCATCTGSGYIFHVENNICTLGTACNESINSTVFENYCRKCLDGCTKCSNVTSCEICATDFVKLPGGDSCLSECPLGYTNYLGICIECPAGCKICPSSGSTCTECLTGLSLLPNQSCIDCRLSGYTQIGANCEKCRIDKCAICNGNPSLCTQCTKNYTLSKNGTCIPCAAPMYLDLDSVCQPCDVDECAQCANSSMMCAVCNPGYVYEGSRCSLAIFGVVKGIFDKKSELIRLTFEQKLFVDEYSPYVQVTVIDKEGNDKKVAISKVEVIQGNLEIKLATEESFIGGVATISLTQPFMFLSSDRLGWTLSPNKSTITANDVTFNYPAKTTGASISQVGGGAAVSVVALITFVVSSNYAIMLIKIYQMMDFMLLYNTEYPRNFYRFIAIFEASNPIESLPDLLYWLYDDNCPEMGEKFIEQEYTCQFVPIVGPYLLFIIAYGILFVVFKVIDIIYKRTQNKKILQKSSNSDEMNESRDALMNPNEKKILAITPKPKPTLIDKAKTYALDFYYSTLGMKGVYMMVQSLDIRVLLAAAVNLQYYAGDVTTTTVSTFNRLLSGTIFIGHPLLLMYFAIETKRALDKGEDPKEHYLLEGRLLSGTYHKYREIFSLARNYAVSFLVVWLYETPLVQMSVLLAIVALSAGLEIKFRTYESKVAYICSGVLWVLYTASSLIFILQKLFGDLIGRSANEIVVGYPLIILFSGLISVNFVPGVFELIDAWRNRNKAKPSLEDEKDLTETKKKELAKQGSKKVAKRIIQGKKPINLVKKQPTLEQTRLRLASTTQGTELLGEADVKAAPKRILKGGTKITRAPRKASMETLNNTHTSLLGPTIKKSSMTKIKSLIKEQKTGTITEHPQSSKVIAKKEISPTQNIRSKSHKKTMQPSLDIPNLKRPTPEGTSLQESTMPLKKVVTARTRTTSKV